MKNFPFLPLIAILGWTLAGAQLARAGNVRFPENSDPAFILTIPDGIKTAPNNGGLQFFFPRGSSFSISMIPITTDLLIQMKASRDPFGGWAQNTFDTLHMQSDGKREAVEIDGKAGVIFYATLVTTAGKFNFELMCVKVDSVHVAEIVLSTRVDVSQEDKDNLDKLIRSIKFTVVE